MSRFTTLPQVRASLEEGIRGEVEGYRAQLEDVKAELAPWEAQMKEVQVRQAGGCTGRGVLCSTAQADTVCACIFAAEQPAVSMCLCPDR